MARPQAKRTDYYLARDREEELFWKVRPESGGNGQKGTAVLPEVGRARVITRAEEVVEGQRQGPLVVRHESAVPSDATLVAYYKPRLSSVVA